LIDRDQKGKSSFGQSVRETFPKADFFIDAQKDVTVQVKRFIELIFGEPFITPTLDEYMMFIAKATALRSCDLSRQVGAVIVDKAGAIVSTGCNEVPIPGGGFFYEGRESTIGDNRDKVEQHDPNFHEIERSIGELIDVMKAAGFINREDSSAKLAEELIHGDHKDLTAEARIRNLIEFGRVVHAEMHAITQAAMLGRSINEATLYCTTYPCHICARHVIASGIQEVVYIEPYPKSLTASLYHREMVSEGDADGVSKTDVENKVVFRSFRGISPTLYQRVFTYRRRKDSYGAIAKWSPSSAKPVGAVPEITRPNFEAFVANGLEKILEQIHNAKNDKNE
jgi:cytidine deaminase